MLWDAPSRQRPLRDKRWRWEVEKDGVWFFLKALQLSLHQTQNHSLLPSSGVQPIKPTKNVACGHTFGECPLA